MHHRFNAARLAGAIVTLVVAAACSDVAKSPTAPPLDRSNSPSPSSLSPSLGVRPEQMEALTRAVIHGTVEGVQRARAERGNAGSIAGASTANDLYYHGGTGGIGVETAPRLYLVFWGSQWNNNDPSGEATLVQNFLTGVGGSSWLNSVTQYCQAVASGTYYCTGGTRAGNPSGILVGVWHDNTSSAASRPRQSQLAAEAVRAAAHFGNTTASSNQSAQYVIATAHGYNASGFGSQYCAYHSSTSSSYGNVAYTNLPYITDAGASCGANFNGLGAKAGITIVEGHELAETISDQFPNSGWLDSGGAENGDKCAWISSGQGASSTVSLSTGTFPVQSLWSNAFNGGAGGCELSY
jgi:serine protease